MILDGPVEEVAPALLGCLLDAHGVTVRLTEVEAYAGEGRDPASHAHRGRTPRSEIMFGHPGRLYVYFSYGMHWCANVVCGTDGVAAAVLLRAGEVVRGAEVAQERRPACRRPSDLARGPARLATCLGLDAGTDGVDLCAPESPVRLERVATRRRPGIVAGPRVGIATAVDRPWRFWLPGEPSVSAYKPGGRKRGSAAPAD